MSAELGKLDKPEVEQFKAKRKLYFVPLIYQGKDAPTEYIEKYDRYWAQVESQISELEAKLGTVTRIYHELVAKGGEEGLKTIKELSQKSHDMVKARLEKGTQLEATEDADILTEFIDWGRCLAIGLQNERVFVRVYDSYQEAGKRRNEYLAKHVEETLKPGESGILFMREGHRSQFAADIEVFYVSPPALDEINRWLRDQQKPPAEKDKTEEEKG